MAELEPESRAQGCVRGIKLPHILLPNLLSVFLYQLHEIGEGHHVRQTTPNVIEWAHLKCHSSKGTVVPLSQSRMEEVML